MFIDKKINEKKEILNNDLAVLPSHNINYWRMSTKFTQTQGDIKL